MRPLTALLFFLLINSRIWAEDNISPYGTFVITAAGYINRSGRMILFDDSSGSNNWEVQSIDRFFRGRRQIDKIGDRIHITPESGTIHGKTMHIRQVRHLVYTEEEFMLETGGSGQGPSTFADIGFEGDILHEFRLRFNSDGHNWNEDMFIQSVLVLSDTKFIIIGQYYYFCDKINTGLVR